MSPRPRRQRLSWWAGAVALPIVLIATLLGVVTSADTALERIPVALVNNDELVEQIDDNGEEEIILASRPLVTELVSSDDLTLNWVITGTEQANELLANGEVYAIIEIPENFSEAVITLDSNEPVQAQFSIRTDASHSYLAGVLADQLGDTVARTISDEFGRTLTEGLFSAIVDLGGGLTDAADAAEEVAEATVELADGVEDLKEGSTELAEGTADLADGFSEFDDGLEEYLDGLRKLADGAEELNRGTKDLPQLSAGVTTYTESLTGLSALLGAYIQAATTSNPPLTLDQFLALPVGTLLGSQAPPGTETLTISDVVSNVNTLASSGPTLSSNVDKAISGVRTGIEGIDDGADALAENSYPLQEGSDEIRSATIDLASGVAEFDDGIGDLRDGTDELAEGMSEFAEGLREGADDFEAENINEPSESTLDTLVAPIGFAGQSNSESIGFQETLTSVLIPIALWFVALLGTLRLPALNQRILGSTSSTPRIFRSLMAPLVGMVSIQAVVAVGLMHTIGGLGWIHLGSTLLIVASSALAFSAAHFVVWLWRPQVLPALSITVGIIQVITLGALIPSEVLPGVYQTVGLLSPIAWATDGLIAAVADADAGRIATAVTSLVVLGTVSLFAAWIALGKKRIRAMREVLGLADAVV